METKYFRSHDSFASKTVLGSKNMGFPIIEFFPDRLRPRSRSFLITWKPGLGSVYMHLKRKRSGLGLVVLIDELKVFNIIATVKSIEIVI